MRNGRPTNRVAPSGYVAVTKPLAEKLYKEGKTVTICGNNVNSFHVFGGWGLGCIVRDDGTEFSKLVESFLSYLEPELGRYAVYYVAKESLRESNTF